MARRRVSVEDVEVSTGPRGPVERVPISSRHLETIGEDHVLWTNLGKGGPFGPAWRGAIVRLRPPHDAPEGAAATLRAQLLRGGAARVVVDPSPKPNAIPAPTVEEVGIMRREGRRDVVMRLARASNSRDPEALDRLLSEVMDAEGL